MISPKPEPIVSVIIPAYDVAPWIAEAVESVLAQSFSDWELIVVNDGSADTVALEAALAPFRDRLTYLVQANLGAGAARNRALAVARGEWVAFLDGDDAWEPDFLRRQLEEVRARDLDMVWSDGWFTGATPRVGVRMMTDYHCRGPVTVGALIAARVNVITSAVVVRRSLLLAAGGFNEVLRRAQDFDLWVRLVHRGARAGYHHQPLIRYRIRAGSLTGDALAQIDRECTVLTHLQASLPLARRESDALHRRLRFLRAARPLLLSKRALERREYSAARALAAEAHAVRPSPKLALVRMGLLLAPGLMRRWYLARTGPEYR